MYEEKENMTTEFDAIITEINQHYGTQLEWKDSYLDQCELEINNK